eukprot:CAMPEP_0184493024 /NCGR_PEP_ID=MMETSP0113_2-20130426/24897_1 /TAXON_ID=91329 /ORGANISM="Norrisiella sphaerica, Strain BC52" /LENGTH=474 /DNA_ID=CAMNT_0026878131 /DNA_START=51 /DNA_END=1475 /DNA_ORIENTATION=-
MAAKKDHGDTIVLDICTEYVKAGWAGEDTPLCRVPAIMVSSANEDEKGQSFMVGHKALEWLVSRHKEGKDTDDLKIVYPIKEGRVEDWEAMTELLRNVFVNEMKVGSHPNCTVMLTDTPMTTEEYRIQFCRVLFSEFRIPSLCIANRGTMALFDSGRSTGVALVSAGDISHAVPVYKGFCLPHATICSKLGGKSVTEILKEGLKRLEIKEASLPAWEPIMEDVREKACFTVQMKAKKSLLEKFVGHKEDERFRHIQLETFLNPTKLEVKVDQRVKKNEAQKEVKKRHKRHLEKLSLTLVKESKNKMKRGFESVLQGEKKRLNLDDSMLYELPKGADGEIISVCDLLRYVSSEALFSPHSIVGNEESMLGLQDLLFKSIKMCDTYLQPLLSSNIVAAGELVEMPGFAQRLEEELYHLVDEMFRDKLQVSLIPALRRRDACWRGGSMFATIPTFSNIKFSRESFQEDEKMASKRYF